MKNTQRIALAGLIGSIVMVLLGLYMFEDPVIVKICGVGGTICLAIFIAPYWFKNRKPYLP